MVSGVLVWLVGFRVVSGFEWLVGSRVAGGFRLFGGLSCGRCGFVW